MRDTFLDSSRWWAIRGAQPMAIELALQIDNRNNPSFTDVPGALGRESLLCESKPPARLSECKPLPINRNRREHSSRFPLEQYHELQITCLSRSLHHTIIHYGPIVDALTQQRSNRLVQQQKARWWSSNQHLNQLSQ